MDNTPGSHPVRPRQRLSLFEVMALIAGLGVGFWMILEDLKKQGIDSDQVILVIVAVLGGLSLVGPVLLLAEGRGHRPWGAGKVLWFSQGMASWLLWPPIVYNRVRGRSFGQTTSGVCFIYGTPLMALYVTSALLAGGWLRRRRRRRLARRSWRESFGLLLALAWACTGLFILYMLYHDDFQRR